MTIHWLADENFNNDIVLTLLRREPSLDILRVQGVGYIASEVFAQDRLLTRAVLCETDSRHGTATVRERHFQRSTCENASDAVFSELRMPMRV